MLVNLLAPFNTYSNHRYMDNIIFDSREDKYEEEYIVFYCNVKFGNTNVSTEACYAVKKE